MGRDFFRSLGLQDLSVDGFARIGAEVVEPGTPLGVGPHAEAAAAMGLPAGVKVGAGLIDAHAGAVGTLSASFGGADVDPRRRLALILGTSACCMAVSDQLAVHRRRLGPLFFGADAGPMAHRGRPVGVRRGDRPADAPASGILRRGATRGRQRL